MNIEFQRIGNTAVVGLLALLLLLISPVFAQASTAEDANLQLTLMHAHTQQTLPGQRIVAYRVLSGRFKWAQSRTTNAQGIAGFSLPDLNEGAVYRFKTRALNNRRSYSAEISAPGAATFEVGKIQLKVNNGASGAPLANTSVVLKIKKPDGRFRWVDRAATNEAGVAYFDPLALDDGASFVAMAKSVVDGRWKYSDPIAGKGSYEFTVGGAPLTVTLLDQLSGKPLPEQRVDVYEKLASGKQKWRTRQYTNEAGQARFDLHGVGDGGEFFLRARPFNNMNAISDLIPSSGEVTFAVGSLSFSVESSADGKPFANERIVLKKLAQDGVALRVGSGITDDEGKIRFSPTEFGKAISYVAQGKSTIDGRWKLSQTVEKPGSYEFSVGNKPLVVTLKNAHSGELLPDVRIIAAEQLPNGKLKWRSRAQTNDKGVASFDLEGLDEGKRYILRALAYNATWAFSDVVTRSGAFDFKVGKIELQVVSGADDSLLVNKKVVLRELRPDARSRWVRSASTDDNGIVRLDPADFSPEKSYIAQTLSPIDHRWRRTEPFSGPLKMRFVVGNKPLHVALLNALSGDPLANRKITAYERLEDGSKKWRSSRVTNENGETNFDLQGLGDGRSYVLRTTPYNGGAVYSEDIKEPGEFTFRVGNVPVTLINSDTEQAIVEQNVYVYRKSLDGELHWAGKGVSDEHGVVHFTLPFDEAEQYVLKLHNPFGNDKKFYSETITGEGAFRFVVDPDGDHSLDKTPPELVILAPQNAAQVAREGLRVHGLATDDKEIKSITVQLTSPANGIFTLLADYDEESKAWGVDIAESLVSVGETVSITVTAEDKGMNQTSQTIQVQIIQDLDAPTLTVTSHSTGDSVPESGFVFAGSVTDQSGVQSLQITVDDPLLGRTLDQLLTVNPVNGNWSVLIAASQISTDQTITVTLTARDTVANEVVSTLLLDVATVDVSARHLLNRITFGATPDLIQELNNIGATAYLQQQLIPQNIDDSVFESTLGSVDPVEEEELEQYVVSHMVHSKRQLREVMTWFWDNHFNTNIRTERGDFANTVAYEFAENRAFRQNALGRFRDLLEISAKSPAMLIYLDLVGNVKADANENYIRELLELHTMRVDGGFMHHDIEAGAEMFTGWTVQNDAFFFNAAEHNGDEQTFLGTLIASGGVEQGEQVLDILATHPSTASFICEKLGQVFISDNFQPSDTSACAAVFLAAGNDSDQMAQVVSFLLTSPEFAASHRTKIKTPVEFVVGIVRNLQAQTQATDLADPMSDMGLTLFRNSIPTGWSETGDDWISTTLLLERIKWANDFATRDVGEEDPATVVDIVRYFSDRGLTTAAAIVGYLLDITMESDFTDQERGLAEDILNSDQPFDINDADNAPYKLRQMLGTVLSYPSYQFQ